MVNIDYFNNRRTIREFSNKEIPAGLISQIISDALRAPTCGNMQLYSVVVTRNKDLREQLAKCHFNQPASTGAPIIMTVCADFNRFVKWCEESGADHGFDNFQSFVAAATDAIIFTQQIVTIAEMHGLGTCYLGTVTYNAPQISEILELPKRVVPVASLAVGYPAEPLPELVERLGIEGVLHEEKYHDYSKEDITAIFKGKEEFEDNKRYVKENDKPSLASVFTDIRYPKKNNEIFSKIYADYIRRQGFEIP